MAIQRKVKVTSLEGIRELIEQHRPEMVNTLLLVPNFLLAFIQNDCL